MRSRGICAPVLGPLEGLEGREVGASGAVSERGDTGRDVAQLMGCPGGCVTQF